MPQVSIIMPYYNAPAYIKEAVTSVINQSFQDWQLLIINDGSNLTASKYVKTIAALDTRILLLENSSNLGIAASRNIGIKRAEGRWIAFLDSDDVWYEDKLLAQLHIANKNNASCVFSSYNLINSSTEIIGNRTGPALVRFSDLKYHNYIGNLTGMYDTHVLGKVYQEDIVHEDYAMWLSILRNTQAICCQKYLAGYRLHASNSTRNKFRSIYNHFKVVRRFGFVRGVLYTAVHIIIAIRR